MKLQQNDGAGAPSSLWNGWVSRVLRRMESMPVARDTLDSDTPLYNLAGLLLQGQILQEKCQRQGDGFSLVVFDFSDLKVIREIYGSSIVHEVTDEVVRKLMALSRRGRVAARTGKTQFAVAMPLGREHVMKELVRVMGSPARVELESGGSEVVIVPNFVVGSAREGQSLEDLHGQLCGKLSRLADEERKRMHYMRRKRERHSQPMGLETLPGPFMRPIPPTMPAPLGAR
jgi:GGDEF domain-containing protein